MFLETKHQRGSVPNLRGEELAVVELNTLEDRENEYRETRIFRCAPYSPIHTRDFSLEFIFKRFHQRLGFTSIIRSEKQTENGKLHPKGYRYS